MKPTSLRYIRILSQTWVLTLVLALAPVVAGADEKDVLTQHNDNLRTGHYPAETELTPSRLRGGQFRWLFDLTLNDSTDQAYAQPLYVHALPVPNLGTRNVVFVATEKNWIYAFDADQGGPIWPPISLGSPVTAETVGGGYYVILSSLGHHRHSCNR
jgi:hypothetical protein